MDSKDTSVMYIPMIAKYFVVHYASLTESRNNFQVSENVCGTIGPDLNAY